MKIQCPSCGKSYSAPPSDGFCECGVELSTVAPETHPQPLLEESTEAKESPLPPTPAPDEIPAEPTGETPVSAAPQLIAAKLIFKHQGTLTDKQFPLQGERLSVGKFDASTGPVDIDLGGLPGSEYVSRRHAELYFEGGAWKVRDLGSTNGIFVKQAGHSGFSPRLTEPFALSDGDELTFGNMAFVFYSS